MTNQQTTEALEPCPFCKFVDISTAYWNGGAWRVICAGCNAEGPNALTEQEANRAWNRSRVSTPIAPVVDNLQRRLFDECVVANWDPERKNSFAEEIAHLHEELSEAFRAWRRYKDCEIREVNGKLEGVPIEFADALIGMFYNAELYGFDLLAAVERKHQFNLNRNYVAEGRQLHAAAPASTVACEYCAAPDCFAAAVSLPDKTQGLWHRSELGGYYRCTVAPQQSDDPRK